MKKYTLENLLSALFALGFEQIDSFLITLMIGKISIEQKKEKQFKYEDGVFSTQFQKYVDFDGLVYKLKEGLTLETDTGLLEDEIYTIKDLFTSGIVNKKLAKYLANFDFRDVIIRKINLIGTDRLDKLSCLFSNKEKNIMYKMFGIEQMHREQSDMSSQAYQDFYNEESIDVDMILKHSNK